MKILLIIPLLFNSLFLMNTNTVASDINKILKSGDGKTIQTAYIVNSVDEEYDVLRHLNLKPISQKLYLKDGNFYDAINTGSQTIFFKVATKKLINKNLPLVI